MYRNMCMTLFVWHASDLMITLNCIFPLIPAYSNSYGNSASDS